MNRWIFILFVFILTACTSQRPVVNAADLGYPDLGAAPELSGDVWLNTSTPLHLADLQGKVVLVDMWTFG
jgi:hypothetical protein